MGKRIMAMLAVVACAVAGVLAMPVGAEAREVTSTGTWGGATYTVYDDGTATVTGKFTVAAPGQVPNALRSCILIDVSGVDTSAVTNMRYMFYYCSSLTHLSGLADWDVSHVAYMDGMFAMCSSLTHLSGLADWDVSHVEGMVGMFSNCAWLTDLSDLASWDTSSVTSMYQMFYYCSRLTRFSMEGWDTSKVTNADKMFYNCSSLSSVTLGPKVTSSSVSQLPTPSSRSPYTGKWVRTDGYGPYTTSELASLPASDRTGTWVWEGTDLSPYVVSFDTNGGAGSVASLSPSPFDGTLTIPDGSALTRPGYDFVSWNTRADGTGTSYAPGTVRNPIHNEATGKPAAGGETVTLYATWKKLPSVEPIGGEFDVRLKAGEQVTINNLPAGASYVVTETSVPPGWTLVRSQGTTGIIVPGL